MNIEYTYILTPICVALLVAGISYIRNKPRKDFGVFTYPKKIIWLVYLGLPTLMSFGVIIILVSPRNSWPHPAADATFGIAALGGYLLICLYVQSFFVQLQSGILTSGSFFFRKTVTLTSIKRFIILEGGRGGQTLELRNEKNKIEFRVADTVQDFSMLASDIRKQLQHTGVSFEHRDKWGEWSGREKK